MDKETEKLVETVAQKVATETATKMREFHQDDLKVLGERMDIGFASVNNRLDKVEDRLDRVENALSTLL